MYMHAITKPQYQILYMRFIISTSNNHLAFQLCRFSTFFPTLPSLLNGSNVIVLSLLVNSVMLHTVLHVFFPDDFVSSEDSLTKLQLLPFFNLLFNSSFFGSQFKYFLLRDTPWPFAAAKSLQSCPTLCDPRDGSPPGSPIPGILQARTLEWVAISFSL